MPIWLSLVLVAFFLAMNAFFVVAEFAMVRVRPSQVEMAMQEGKPGAKAAKRVTSNVNAYLSACQLGITLASLALGWLGEPAFSALVRVRRLTWAAVSANWRAVAPNCSLMFWYMAGSC